MLVSQHVVRNANMVQFLTRKHLMTFTIHINPLNTFTHANQLSPNRVVPRKVAVDSIARTTVAHTIPKSRLCVFCLIAILPSCTHIITLVSPSHIVLNFVLKSLGFRKMKEIFCRPFACPCAAYNWTSTHQVAASSVLKVYLPCSR
jgi:hypothetical protein